MVVFKIFGHPVHMIGDQNDLIQTNFAKHSNKNKKKKKGGGAPPPSPHKTLHYSIGYPLTYSTQ